MVVPLAPTVLSPSSQHVRIGTSLMFQARIDPTDTSNPLTGYDFLLASSNGTVPYVRVTSESININPAIQPTITAYTNVTSAIPQNTPLAVAARFKNVDGWGPWSDTGHFPFQSTNFVPVASAILNPADSSTVHIDSGEWASSFTVSWNDPDNDPISAYQLVIQTATGVGVYAGTKTAYTGGSTLTVSGPSLGPGDYRFQMRVWDSAGIDDAQSMSAYYPATWSYFTVETGGTSAAGAPSIDTTFISTPVGETIYASSPFQPTFVTRWTDPGNKSMVGYQINLYTSATQTSPYLTTGFVSYTIENGATVSFTPAWNLNINAHYWWEMQVKNTAGQVSAFSPRIEFWGETSPGGVEQPTAVAVSPSGNVNTILPTFVANFVNQGINGNNLRSYNIVVKRQSDGVVMWNKTFTATNQEVTTRQISQPYAGTTLVAGTAYNWTITMTNTGGLTSAASAATVFTVVATGPNAPDITGGNGVVLTTTPVFTGTYNIPTDGVNMNAVWVLVYDDPTGNNVRFNSGFKAVSGPNGTPWSVTFSPGTRPLAPGDVIYWKAATRDVNNIVGPFTAMQTTTIQSVPGAPINLTPITSQFFVFPSSELGIVPVFAGDHQANTNGNSMNAATVEVYADAAMTTRIWTSNVVSMIDKTRFRIAYTGTPLAKGQTIYWRAQTRDSVSNFWGTWSDLQALVVNSSPTNATNLIPNSGAAVGTTQPTLTWTPNMGDPLSHIGGAPDGERSVFSRIDIINSATNLSLTGGSVSYPLYTADIYDPFNIEKANLGSGYGVGWPATDWNVSAALGGLKTVAGRAIGSGTPSNVRAYKTGPSDCLVGAFVQFDGTTGAKAGLLLRRVDANTFWTLTLDGGTNPALVLRYTTDGGSTYTIVSQVTASDVSNPLDVVSGYDVHLAAVLDGPTITAYVNGVQALLATNATGQTGTGFGLFLTGSTTASFDNFYCAGPSAGDPQYQVPSGAGLVVDNSYVWTTATFDGYVMGPVSNTAAFTTVDGPSVSITAPTAGALLPSPTPQISWAYTITGLAGAQASYNVRIMEGANQVFSSGTIGSSDTTFTVPSGYLVNGHNYVVYVTVTDATFNLAATSTGVAFNCVWTPPPLVLDFTAIGNDTSATVGLAWTKSALSVSDFVRYELYRQDGLEDSELILNITDINTTSVTDAFPPRSSELTYTIRQVQRVGSDLVPGGYSTATAAVNFRDMWITSLKNTSLAVRLVDQPQRNFTPTRDEIDVRYWGDAAPTRHIGKGLYTQFQVSGTLFGPDSLTSPSEDESFYLDILDEIYKSKSVVCYRDGRGRKFFANFSYTVTDNLPHSWTVQLSLVQTKFKEGV